MTDSLDIDLTVQVEEKRAWFGWPVKVLIDGRYTVFFDFVQGNTREEAIESAIILFANRLSKALAYDD